MVTTERHQDISDQLLDQAEAEFRKGDFLQASEKAWGAVAHYVKSVASDWGWQNRTHRDVNRNACELIALTDDPKLNAVRLGAANALHQNFYEDWFDRRPGDGQHRVGQYAGGCHARGQGEAPPSRSAWILTGRLSREVMNTSFRLRCESALTHPVTVGALAALLVWSYLGLLEELNAELAA